MNDPLPTWAREQQVVAEASVEHNRTAELGAACVRCGRKGQPFNYRFGRKDEPVCRDGEACIRASNSQPEPQP